MFKIVAFYTENTPYEEHVEPFIEACEAFDLPYYVEPVERAENWVANCGLKPQFLARCLEAFDEDILYLDIDARVRQPLDYFNSLDCDIGVHYLNGKELLSGTILLRNTQKTREIVNSWCREQKKKYSVWDQRVLQSVLAQDKSVKVVDIPGTYTQIFDTMKGLGKPHIEHLQASRKLKSKVSASYVPPPDIVEKRRARVGLDGSFFFPRPTKSLEAKMDAKYMRIPGEARWRPHETEFPDVSNVKLDSNEIYIVGKGPSLDHACKETFPLDIPIVCVNESIHKIDSLGLPHRIFAIQQDAGLKSGCYPISGELIVSRQAQHHYAGRDRVYVYFTDKYKLRVTALTVLCAIRIFETLDVKMFNLVSFDAAVADKKTAYANCIGYSPTAKGPADRFLNHCTRIIRENPDSDFTWLLPREEDTLVFDKTQQSQSIVAYNQSYSQ